MSESLNTTQFLLVTMWGMVTGIFLLEFGSSMQAAGNVVLLTYVVGAFIWWAPVLESAWERVVDYYRADVGGEQA